MIDEALRTELKIVIENDGDLYRQRKSPIQENLRRRWKKGQYDHAAAPKLWLYLVDDGARKYQTEYPGVRVDRATRQAIAQDFADEWREELLVSEGKSQAPAPSNRTISDIKAANKRAGQNFFDRDSMKFFNTVIERGVYGGRFFVTKERPDSNRPWKWSVRKALDDGRIETIGAFYSYDSLGSARDDAKELAGQSKARAPSKKKKAPKKKAAKKKTAKRKVAKKKATKKRTPTDNECRLSWSGEDYSAAKVAALLDMAPWKLTAAQAKVRSSLKSAQPIKCTVVQTAHAQLVRKAKTKTKGNTLADTIQGALAQGLDDKDQFRVGAGARPKVTFKR